LSLISASEQLEFRLRKSVLHCRHSLRPTYAAMRRNKGIPRPRPTPRPTRKLVWSVVEGPLAAGAISEETSEGVGVGAGAEDEVVAASWLLVVVDVVEESALVVAEALLVSEIGVLLGSEVDVSLVLASVCVLSTTTVLDVLGTLGAELEGIGSVMLK
jgi:hypothetical protein